MIKFATLALSLVTVSQLFAASFEEGYEGKFFAPLNKEDKAEIAKQLLILQATIDDLCIKSRGFSSNVVSADFYEYHSFLNLTIEYLQKASYDVSERVRALNGWSNKSLSDIKQKSLLTEQESVVTRPEEMVTELAKDYTTASDHSRGIFRMAASIGDAGTIALMTQTTFKLEHFLWEINVMKEGGKVPVRSEK